jgi:hypothetical protein
MKFRKFVAVAVVISLPWLGAAPVGATSTNPYGTATIDPAGPNEIILVISKGKRKVEFAFPRLLKMKQETITIYEPFLKKRQSFSVIPLKTFFAFLGIKGGDKVITTALNDYIYSNTAAQFIAADGYLAIKREGAAIGYDQGGPIRIIYPDKSKWAKNLDAWNWSLSSIQVR